MCCCAVARGGLHPPLTPCCRCPGMHPPLIPADGACRCKAMSTSFAQQAQIWSPKVHFASTVFLYFSYHRFPVFFLPPFSCIVPHATRTPHARRVRLISSLASAGKASRRLHPTPPHLSLPHPTPLSHSRVLYCVQMFTLCMAVPANATRCSATTTASRCAHPLPPLHTHSAALSQHPCAPAHMSATPAGISQRVSGDGGQQARAIHRAVQSLRL